MTHSEKSILNQTLVRITALPKTIAWRNNTGQAWQGKKLRFYPGTTIPVPAGMVLLAEARPISFGLPGSADILGASCGRPLAVETKTATGDQFDLQVKFQRAWEAAGGLYVLARSPDQVVDSLTS